MLDSRRRADYVEDIFAGVVAAAYNYLNSILLLIISPRRGAIRLAVRRSLPQIGQLAPHTIIFISACVVYASAGQNYDLTSALRGFVVQQTVALSAVVIATRALCITLVSDVVLRALAFAIYRNNRRRRVQRVTVALYAYAGMLVYISMLLPLLFWEQSSNYGCVVAPVMFLTLLLAPAGVTRILLGADKMWVVRLTTAILLITSLLGTLTLAKRVSVWATTQREDLELTHLQCVTDNGAVLAEVVIRNPSSKPTLIRPEQSRIRLHAGSNVISLQGEIIDSSLGRDRSVYLIPSGEAAWFMFRADGMLGRTLRGSDVQCTLPILAENGDDPKANVHHRQ